MMVHLHDDIHERSVVDESDVQAKRFPQRACRIITMGRQNYILLNYLYMHIASTVAVCLLDK